MFTDNRVSTTGLALDGEQLEPVHQWSNHDTCVDNCSLCRICMMHEELILLLWCQQAASTHEAKQGRQETHSTRS